MTQIAPPPTTSPSSALDLLLDLASALQKHATYPAGHPLLIAAVERALGAVSRAMAGRDALVIGVSPGRIFVDSEELPAGNLLLRDLTLRLHRRELAGLRLVPGVTREELLEVLGVIGGGEAAPGEVRLRWPHLRLVPLSYDRLELLDDADPEAPAATGAAELWDRLTRAALVADDDGRTGESAAGVARAIEERLRDGAAAGELFGHFAALVRQAGQGGGDGAAIRRHLSELVAALDPGVLDALISGAPPGDDASALLREGSRSLAPYTVFRLLQAERRRAGTPLSPALAALLGKLAALAEGGPQGARSRAGRALRSELRLMIEQGSPAIVGEDEQGNHNLDPECGLTEPGDAERLLWMSVELGVVAPATLRAADDLLAAGNAARLLSIADHASTSSPVAESLRARVLSPDTLARALARDTLDTVAAERLVRALGDDAAAPILDAFLESDDRPRQRRLAVLAGACAEAVARCAGARMASAPRRSQRALLHLLRHLDATPPPLAERFLRHPDPTLRHAAARLLLDSPRLEEVRAAMLASDDEHLVRLALRSLRGEPAGASVLPRLRELAGRDDLHPAPRCRAIAALAHDTDPATLQCLVGITLLQRTLLRRARLAPASPAVVGAVSVLARRWSDAPEARTVLALAAESADAALRAAARGEAA